MRPVPLEKQWTLWPRIVRPFECRTCGHHFGPTFDPETESKERQIMRAGTWEDALPYPFATFGGDIRVHHRVPRWRYCRNRECQRFYDYEDEKRRIKAGRDTHVLLLAKSDRLPMRRRWLATPEAANEAH